MATARRPSIRHVAVLAGVSIQTVSRVLNEPDRVRPETRERVLTAIESVGYTPNATARSLRGGRSHVIGFLLNGDSLRGPSSAIPQLVKAADAAGLASLTSVYFEDAPEASRASVDRMLAQNVDAVVVIAARAWAAEEAERIAERVPVVAVQARASADGIHRVSVDQDSTIALAMDHLVERGCGRLGYVAGPHQWFDGAARNEGWETHVRSLGLPAVRVETESFEAAEGHRAAGELLDDLPDGIVCANDFLAVGLIRRLHEAGQSVPSDCLVVGVDDSHDDAFLVPSLSSVTQPLDLLADRAMDAVQRALTGEPARVDLVEPELVVRESSTRRS